MYEFPIEMNRCNFRWLEAKLAEVRSVQGRQLSDLCEDIVSDCGTSRSEGNEKWFTERLVLLLSTSYVNSSSLKNGPNVTIEDGISRIQGYIRLILNQIKNCTCPPPYRMLLSCVLAAINKSTLCFEDLPLAFQELRVGDVLEQSEHDDHLLRTNSDGPKEIEIAQFIEAISHKRMTNWYNGDDRLLVAKLFLVFEALRVLNCTNYINQSFPDVLNSCIKRNGMLLNLQEMKNWPVAALAALGEEQGRSDRDQERDLNSEFRADNLDLEKLIDIGDLEIRWDVFHKNHLLLDKVNGILTLCWFALPPSPWKSDYDNAPDRRTHLWYQLVSNSLSSIAR
jgi:hypothetical protein